MCVHVCTYVCVSVCVCVCLFVSQANQRLVVLTVPKASLTSNVANSHESAG